MGSEIIATKAKLGGGGREGPGEVTQRPHDPHGQSRKLEKPHLTMFQKLPYLLVGVRPVKAQEKVGGLAMQQEVGGPEWDGKALEGVAEVKRDPEVLGISICKDVLQEEKKKKASSEQTWPGPPTAPLLTARAVLGACGASVWLPRHPRARRCRCLPSKAQGRKGCGTGWDRAKDCSPLTR